MNADPRVNIGEHLAKIARRFAPGSVIPLPAGEFLIGVDTNDLDPVGGFAGDPEGGTKLVMTPGARYGLFKRHSGFSLSDVEIDMQNIEGAWGVKVHPLANEKLTGIRLKNVTVTNTRSASAFGFNGVDDLLMTDCSAFDVVAAGEQAVHVHGVYLNTCQRAAITGFTTGGHLSGAAVKLAASDVDMHGCWLEVDSSKFVAGDLRAAIYAEISGESTIRECRIGLFNSLVRGWDRGADLRFETKFMAFNNRIERCRTAFRKQEDYKGELVEAGNTITQRMALVG